MGCTQTPKEAPPTFALPEDLLRLDFRLIDSEGKMQTLSAANDQPSLRLVAWVPGCSDAQALLNWAGKERSWLLNPGLPQNRAEVNQLRGSTRASTVLMDPSQTISRSFGFRRSGEYLTIDTATWKLRERGSAPVAEAPCALPFSNAKPRLDSEVIGALQRTCLGCHQQGGAEPFFQTPDELANWQAMNSNVLRLYNMPPGGLDYETPSTWPSFRSADLSLIQNWVDQGSVHGPEALPLYAEALKKAQPPPLPGAPDIVWEMAKPDHIPASGGVRYAHRQFGPTPRDLYIRAVGIEMNLRATHHLAVFYARAPFPAANKPLEFTKEDVGSMGGPQAYGKNLLNSQKAWTKVVEWAFSKAPRVAYPGTVFFIPKGSYVLLEHHYQPNGTEQENRSRLSLYLDPQPEKKLIAQKMIMPRRGFSIPPHAKDFHLITGKKIEKDISIFSFLSHGHYRHNAYRVGVIYADGSRKQLANVPYRLFDHSFEFKLLQPIFLPTGAKLEFDLAYDNSAGNPLNPDPSVTVRSGTSLSQNEMDIGQITYVEGKMPGAVDLRNNSVAQ